MARTPKKHPPLTKEQWDIVLDNRGLGGIVLSRMQVPKRLWNEYYSDYVLPALIASARLFDPLRGTKFTTYASKAIWMRIVSHKRKKPLIIDPVEMGYQFSQEDIRREETDSITHIRSRLKKLPVNLRRLIELRWLRKGKRSCTIVGQKLGVSRQTVLTWEKKAFRLLREGIG